MNEQPRTVTVLVVAKAPAPGRVKTRLAADIGAEAAAHVAAAALLDTIDACAGAVGPDACRLAVDGDLASAVCADELASALVGWTVVPQTAGTLGERIAAACSEIGGAVVQIGMDTPQVTPDLLRGAAEGLASDDAVLGPAVDGGWWLLGMRDGAAGVAISGVAMSRPDTGEQTRRALTDAGLTVGTVPPLRDVDDLADLRAVVTVAPGTRTARATRELAR